MLSAFAVTFASSAVADVEKKFVVDGNLDVWDMSAEETPEDDLNYYHFTSLDPYNKDPDNGHGVSFFDGAETAAEVYMAYDNDYVYVFVKCWDDDIARHEIDTGDIIAQQAIDIAPDENVGSVHDRLMHLGADLTIATLNNIIAGTLKTVPQNQLLNDGQQPTPAPKIFKETCRINWNQPAADIYNLIRGLSPYPAAWTTLSDETLPEGGLQLKVFEAQLTDIPATAPGNTSITAKGEMLIDCADKAIALTQVQLQGRKRMKTDDFLRGAKLSNPKVS